MPSLEYGRNYTTSGYTLNYLKPELKSLGFLRNAVYQFRIEMPDILPSIWRQIQVPPDYNFWDLHVAIQDAMGWLDSHLHHFEIKAKGKHKWVKIGIPDFDLIEEEPEEEVFPGWEIPMDTYFNDLGLEARYLYDYGDSWWHTVKLEGYMARRQGGKYPVCIDGERACPPEDCGGISGYAHLIEILANPKHEEYEEMKIWAGDKWHPDRFAKDAVEIHDPYKRWKTAILEP